MKPTLQELVITFSTPLCCIFKVVSRVTSLFSLLGKFKIECPATFSLEAQRGTSNSILESIPRLFFIHGFYADRTHVIHRSWWIQMVPLVVSLVNWVKFLSFMIGIKQWSSYHRFVFQELTPSLHRRPTTSVLHTNSTSSNGHHRLAFQELTPFLYRLTHNSKNCMCGQTSIEAYVTRPWES